MAGEPGSEASRRGGGGGGAIRWGARLDTPPEYPEGMWGPLEGGGARDRGERRGQGRPTYHPSPVGPSNREALITLLRISNVVLCGITAALLLVQIAILMGSPFAVIPGLMEQDHWTQALFLPLPFPPWLAVARIPLAPAGGAVYYIIIAAGILFSFINLLKREKEGVAGFIRSFTGDIRWPRVGSSSALIRLPQLFMALMFFQLAFILILNLMGVATRAPPGFEEAPLWLNMYTLANASVVEELISRSLYIGLPLLIWHLLRRQREGAWQRYLLGGGFDPFRPSALVLVIMSSLTFALAHLGGWDWWKVIPVFVSGLALGYLFLHTGLFAAILLHFLFDFLIMPAEVLGPAADLAYSLLVLIIVLGGSVYFFHLSYRTFRALGGTMGGAKKEGRGNGP